MTARSGASAPSRPDLDRPRTDESVQVGADHVVLTRFNVPTPGVESLIRAKEGWLRQRVELFETYTLPSMERQQSPFRWIGYFDPQGPQGLMDKVHRWSEDGRLVPIFREAVPREVLLDDITEAVGGPTARAKMLITTNLDNDDGVAADFLTRIRAAADDTQTRAIYLVDGLILHAGRIYRRRDLHNAFCSVRAPWSAPLTCWADWHNRLSDHMGVLEVPGPPAWLQVVHGSNVSNRVNGQLVDARGYRARFSPLLDDVESPSAGRRLADRLLARPGRWLRESGRARVKNVVLKLGGRDGLERMKSRLRSVHR